MSVTYSNLVIWFYTINGRCSSPLTWNIVLRIKTRIIWLERGGFNPRPGQTKLENLYLLLLHQAFRSNNKDWLAWNRIIWPGRVTVFLLHRLFPCQLLMNQDVGLIRSRGHIHIQLTVSRTNMHEIFATGSKPPKSLLSYN